MTSSTVRDARIRLPEDLIRALDFRCGDVSRSLYVRRLIEQDEHTGGAVYAAAAQRLRPHGSQGNGVVPAAELDPSVGAAASPPSGAVPPGPAEPSPVADVDDEPDPVDVDPSGAEHRPPTPPPRRRAPRSAEEWGR